MNDILIFTHLENAPTEEASVYLELLGMMDWKRRACYLILNHVSIKDHIKDIEMHCRHLSQSRLVIFDANYGTPNSVEFNQTALMQVLSGVEKELERAPEKNLIFHIRADNVECYKSVIRFMGEYIRQHSTGAWLNGFNIAIRLENNPESLKSYGNLLASKFAVARPDVTDGVVERTDRATQTIEELSRPDVAVQAVKMVDTAVQTTQAPIEMLNRDIQVKKRQDQNIQASVDHTSLFSAGMRPSYRALQRPSHHEVTPICHSPCIELQRRALANPGVGVQKPISFAERTNSSGDQENAIGDQENTIGGVAIANPEPKEKKGSFHMIRTAFCCR